MCGEQRCRTANRDGQSNWEWKLIWHRIALKMSILGAKTALLWSLHLERYKRTLENRNLPDRTKHSNHFDCLLCFVNYSCAKAIEKTAWFEDIRREPVLLAVCVSRCSQSTEQILFQYGVHILCGNINANEFGRCVIVFSRARYGSIEVTQPLSKHTNKSQFAFHARHFRVQINAMMFFTITTNASWLSRAPCCRWPF